MTEGNITSMIHRWRAGDQHVIDELMPLIYDQLHEIAWRSGDKKGIDSTMRPTALVNEAFIKMQSSSQEILDRTHFFAAAALTMRRIIIDFARKKQRDKHGAGLTQIEFKENLSDHNQGNAIGTPNIIALNEALEQLENQDSRKARIIELHYFAGLNYEEISEVLKLSAATVGRELMFARTWLANELEGM